MCNFSEIPGGCTKGASCPYTHISPTVCTEVCLYFGTPDGCLNGDNCPYIHLPPKSLGPCWFFGTPSGCSKASCPYDHPPTEHVIAATTTITTTAAIIPGGLCCCCPKPPRPDAEKTPEIVKFVEDFKEAYGYTPVILERVHIPS